MDQLEQLDACRVCVTCFPIQEMDFIDIFKTNEEFQQELNFIQGEISHWQLKIHADDGLPQRICANCFTKFCSIEAFRKECEQAQEKLIATLMQQTSNSVPAEVEENQIIKVTDNPLQMAQNYAPDNVNIDPGANVLVSSVNLTQSDVSLNDFPVFEQQFSQFGNPLMDTSPTLLDDNIIASETTQELEFVPPQNLFTFETAGSASTGTLPIVETESTSIMNDVLVEGNSQPNQNFIKQEDLENMLPRSIVTTTTKLEQQSSIIDNDQQIADTSTMESLQGTKCDNKYLLKSNGELKEKGDYQNTTSSFLNHDDTTSDIECDESEISDRLKGLSYACHYCFCPDTGSIDHLVFPDEDALSQHFFDIHDPNRPYTCPKCQQSYKTQLLRDNHVRFLHKATEIQACNYCQKRLKGSMDVHQYNCQYVGDWECQHCKEKFSNIPYCRFYLHQRQHERVKNFKCRLCERSFIRKANLEAHQRMHKADSQTALACDICEANFADDYELKRHKYQQHGGEAPLKCKICHKSFSSKMFLQRHMSQLHANNLKNDNINGNVSASSSSSSSTTSPGQYTCENCNVVFKSLQKLQNHLLLGRDKNGNCLYSSCNKQERRKLQRQGVFPCFHCPRRFHLRSQLDKHLNTHDARLRPFQCLQCVTRCRTAFELKQHVNVAHLNIKAFSCDKCGKCFGYKKDLRDHMLFHAEVNVHCKEEGCDYVCKNEKALNDHVRHKHRLLSCEYCHEQFTRQKLTSHLRNIHRAQIDVELAGKSDNYYKSQLLNNNNDITQISFNLLNTQQEQQLQQLVNSSSSTAAQLPPSSSPSSSQNVSVESVESVSLPTQMPSSQSLSLSSSSSSSSPTSSSNSNVTSSLASSTKGTNIISNISTSISTDNLVSDINQNQQLCTMFANNNQDANAATLALNNLGASEHDLNLATDGSNNVFLVPEISSAPTDNNQIDQYFMASLIDTEQEIIVT